MLFYMVFELVSPLYALCLKLSILFIEEVYGTSSHNRGHHVNVRYPRRAYRRVGKGSVNNVEGAVLEEGETMEWFQVKSGVKQ